VHITNCFRDWDDSELHLDSGGFGGGAVTLDIDILRIELGLQLLPFLGLVINDIADDLVGILALLLTALAALRLQGVRQGFLELPALRRALSSVHQALEVVTEEAVRLQDLVHVDVVVLGGVLILGGDQNQPKDEKRNYHLHVDGFCGQIGGKHSSLISTYWSNFSGSMGRVTSFMFGDFNRPMERFLIATTNGYCIRKICLVRYVCK